MPTYHALVGLVIACMCIRLADGPIVILYKNKTHQLYINSSLFIFIIMSLFICYLYVIN